MSGPEAQSRQGARLERLIGRTVFGEDVQGYHSARPGYPEQIYRAIEARLPASPEIAEIGAGTGLATERLLTFAPARYVAFEPDERLAQFLHQRFPDIGIQIEDFCTAPFFSRFDLIVSASSFHWLDPELALKRAHQWLKPGGCLAIWWNVYRQRGVGDLFAEAVLPLLSDIAQPPSEEADQHYSLDAEGHRGRLEAAGFDAIEHYVIRRENPLSPAAARALYASFSLVRQLPADRACALLDAIERIVTEQFGGLAPAVVLSPIYLATRR